MSSQSSLRVGRLIPTGTAWLSIALAVAVLIASAVLLDARPARAGCGCAKAPPALAYVRPHVTWAGTPVNLFHADLAFGAAYRARFVSAAGPSADVVGTGFERRDVADGLAKTHLTVAVPNLPPGPASIEVYDESDRLVLVVPDDDFTVAPDPVVLPSTMGVNRFTEQRAAIGRDGTVYLSVDLSALAEARTLDIWGQGLPLQFGLDDVAFYNTQGFLMQLLDQPIPGLVTFDVVDGGKRDSSRLRYFRHEFESYILAHDERGTHAIDPTDPGWHLDGSPHIDHDHLIVAIAGSWKDGAPRDAGASDPFTLMLNPLSEQAAPKP
jgi:hypothetical protein